MSTIRANTITDTAGTGAPTFSNGIKTNAILDASGGNTATINLYAVSTTELAGLTAGTSGQILQSNGASAPSWVTPNAPAFTSAESTAAALTLFTFAHGLGRVPYQVQANLRCATASNGFAVDQTIVLAGSYTTSIGYTVSFDATNIYVAVAGNINVFTPAAVTLTLSNFRISARAW
jgi:hypothetical protein